MQYKTFYLIVLFGTSLLSGFYLFYLWMIRKKTKNSFLKDSNIALILISISFFHRTFIVGNKLFDIQDFSLDYVVVDRMISSVSNLIFLLSISYFPLLNEENRLTRLIKQREKWFAIVFIVFISIISIFTFLDKFYDNFGTLSRIIIVILDALVSIFCILLLGYIMKLSLSGFKLSSVVLKFIMFSFILFSTTQIILPLSKVLPELLYHLYPIFLALFLVFYFGFVISFFLYFLSLEYLISAIQVQEDNVNFQNEKSEIHVISVKKIEIGFQNKLNSYLKVQLELSNLEIETVTINNNKILHPFLYWMLFSISKRNNISLFNNDISVAKFRMIEYFNRYSTYKITQELLFSNDNGEYSLLINSDNIIINDKDIIGSKKSFSEIVIKYAECYISKYDAISNNNSKLKSEKIKFFKENTMLLIENLLKF
ncbi:MULTISPECIES: hypothetical protein [unclassified Flavobacterium]|uniref:hypothetical protein n=1 Tax=unclassified Flavobacterium TaxID=196869 RepID=UPI001291175F|nr:MULTISPECIES: hypothetical protein [unclassified Flavobacterium]MQP52864.1 hypothetical protein [Flavobacterium sp. LMO9]MQP63138.1 hypothetical protein [Flavobacterium sp. LMO6]